MEDKMLKMIISVVVLVIIAMLFLGEYIDSTVYEPTPTTPSNTTSPSSSKPFKERSFVSRAFSGLGIMFGISSPSHDQADGQNQSYEAPSIGKRSSHNQNDRYIRNEDLKGGNRGGKGSIMGGGPNQRASGQGQSEGGGSLHRLKSAAAALKRGGINAIDKLLEDDDADYEAGDLVDTIGDGGPNPFERTASDDGKNTNPTEQIKDQFLDQAQIAVDLPQGFFYSELDMDDGIGGVQGRNPNTGVDLSLLARPGATTVEQAQSYLTQFGSEIIQGFHPNLVSGQPQVAQPNSGSGLSESYYWTGNTQGKDVVISMTNRSDGQGTYVVILQGPPGYFENDEALLDSIYDSIRTK